MMNKEEIFEIVRTSVSESLAIHKEQVKLESRLINDLGADSLDFLDMIFNLEKRFGVRLRDARLDLLVRADFSQTERTHDGVLSEESIAKLAEWLPELRDARRVTIPDVYSFITVATLARLIEEKLNL